MDVKLFNTLTGSIESLKPLHGNEVRMYHCGPTVYDYAHVGNLRSFLMNDTLKRTLAYASFDIKQMMNITDIDDKIIDRSRTEGVSAYDLTHRYTDFLLADLRHLNIQIPENLPRATDHVGSMIALIEKLMREGYAYLANDGIYFDVARSPHYGALARLDLTASTQSRIEDDASGKKNPRDFALWKFWTSEDGEVVYDASFGRGRPGWHIECSAMAMTGLGETIDIHTGGVDLVFPHHTNEIAQSEAVTGKQFVNLWLHNEFVMIEGQKMSKSLGNVINLKTIIDRGFSPLAFRYYMLGSHYRSKANFTWEALEGATTALKKLEDHIGSTIGSVNLLYRERFLEIITNDLDTPRALALLWEVAKDKNLSSEDRTATLLDFDSVLGLNLKPKEELTVPDSVKNLLSARNEARLEKDWATSDKIRADIQALGYDVLDTGEGQRVSKL